MFPARAMTILGGDSFRDEYSLSFDGTDENIRIPATTFDVDDNTISFVFWAKRAATNAVHCVLGNTGEAESKHLRFTSAGNIKLENNTAAEEAVMTLNTDDTSWHHYVVAVSSGTVTAYQDGIAMSVSGSTLTTTAVTFDTIAGQGTSGDSYNFNGNISEIAAYNITLTSSQAKMVYNDREPFDHKNWSKTGNLTQWWRMGDCRLDDGNGLIGDETNAILDGNIQNTAFSADATIAGFTGESATGFTAVNTNAGDGVNDNAYGKALSLTAGHTYKLSWTTTINAGDLSQQLDVAVATAIGGGSGDTATAGTHTAAGDYVNYFTVSSTATHYVVFRLGGNGTYNFTISNVSLQKVNGNPGTMINMEATDFTGDTP